MARAGPSRILLILSPLTQLKLEIFTNCQNSTLSHVIQATSVVMAVGWRSPRSFWPIMAALWRQTILTLVDKMAQTVVVYRVA